MNVIRLQVGNAPRDAAGCFQLKVSSIGKKESTEKERYLLSLTRKAGNICMESQCEVVGYDEVNKWRDFLKHVATSFGMEFCVEEEKEEPPTPPVFRRRRRRPA